MQNAFMDNPNFFNYSNNKTYNELKLFCLHLQLNVILHYKQLLVIEG